MSRLPGRPPPEAYLQPPLRRHRSDRHNLSIKTIPIPSLLRQTSTSSSSRPAVNINKKPIHPNKIQHASKLYSEFRMKEGLAQLSPDPNATSSSSIRSYGPPSLPGPLTNASRSSRDMTAPSFDAVSEFSSVISFDTGSQSSRKSGRRNEAFSYQGNAVAQRTRKKFEPVGRARTALIRYLGACQHCKFRNVKCLLEHHDIESLERAHQSNSTKQESDLQYNDSDPPIYESQVQNTASEQATPVTSHGQYEALRGIGEKFGVAPEVPCNGEVLFSPGAFDLETGFGLDIYDSPATLSLEARVTDFYSPTQNGGQFPLGFWHDSTFRCNFLDGDCPQSFAGAEALQTHFETTHFEFTRISPFERLICTRCCRVIDDYACKCGGIVKLFICGNYIRTTQYPTEPPARQPHCCYTGLPTSITRSESSDSSFDLEQGLGFNVNEAQIFDSDANASLYGGGDNIYPGPNAGGFDAYTYDSTQPGGNRYNGYAWTFTQGAHKAATAPIRYCVMKCRQASKHQKVLIYMLLSLTIILASLQIYDWITLIIISKVDLFLPSMPTLGFIGFLVSFITSWAAKRNHTVHQAKRCKMRRCPLHAFTPPSKSIRTEGAACLARYESFLSL
ncbi:hypothetical protein SBOR_3266 [Sclerotinia borealis F-4128]|uniref:C2H2-type domain-containing protein n=1 Tax=Sclerotinia borealis (strain F-4128) TaxID=1432307 RepID=W9CP07_SCLBF|nr:hypothetical protein SBOR_3266 [Sclerotinia borealis F-4128]